MPLSIDNFGFELLGSRCYPIPDREHGFYYLPLGADTRRNSDGKPQGQLIAAGDTAFLQIATAWDLPGQRLEDLRRALAEREGVAEPALVQLAFAPVRVEPVRLLAGDGSDPAVELATARSSGMPPWAAMFSLPLSGADRDRAMAAFNGRTGFLVVRYAASLAAPVRHAARIEGDLAGLTDVARLEAALADGRARLTFDAGDAALRDAFVARAAEMLAALEPAGTGDVSIELVVNETASIVVDTDVGSWFPAGDAVTPAPGPGFPPTPEAPAGLAVELDLPGVDEVVTVVEVTGAAAAARLVGPEFAAVSLPRPAEPDATLALKTSFVEGGEDFVATRPVPEGPALQLAAEDLGLIAVTVDAGPLAELGLERARTTLYYRPSGPGSRDLRTFYFERAPWSARWWLVARGEPLGESLSYDLSATLTSGERLRHGPVAAPTSTITLNANSED